MTDKKKTDVETCDSSTSMDERDTDWLSSGHKNPLYRCLLSGWSTKEFFAEFLGTFILMVINNGVGAMYTVARQTDTLAMGYVGGIGAMCGIMVSLPVSGGHINPSVTVAFALCKRLPANKVLHYLLGQYLGSFCAQVMVWTLYYEHINAFDGGLRSAVIGDPKATGKIFATFPPPTASLHTCIIDQIFCTSLLLIVVCAIIDPRGMKIPVYLQPFVISVLIAGLSTALGFNAGGMNPARDLAPRVFTIVAGYGLQAFAPLGGHYWYAVGVLAPHTGALIGTLVFDYLIGRHLEKKAQQELHESLVSNMYLSPAEDSPGFGNTFTVAVDPMTMTPIKKRLMLDTNSNSIDMEDLTIMDNHSGNNKSSYHSTSNSQTRSRSKSIIYLSRM